MFQKRSMTRAYGSCESKSKARSVGTDGFSPMRTQLMSYAQRCTVVGVDGAMKCVASVHREPNCVKTVVKSRHSLLGKSGGGAGRSS